MRNNYIHEGARGEDNRIYLTGDWYTSGIPSNVVLAKNVFIDSSYGFAAFRTTQPNALFIDEASGCYDRASFIVSATGKVQIGKFCILNGSTIICNDRIIIGDHCMLAWGVVITDNWLDPQAPVQARQNILNHAASDGLRNFPVSISKPVIIEDNVWVGFDAVIMPGVTLGRGCVVACKTVVDISVPSYAVVGGSPARIIKYLSPDDTEESRTNSINNVNS